MLRMTKDGVLLTRESVIDHAGERRGGRGTHLVEVIGFLTNFRELFKVVLTSEMSIGQTLYPSFDKVCA
jgi:hypothetical protein